MAKKLKLSPERAYSLAEKASRDSNSFAQEGCLIWDSSKGIIFATGYSCIPIPYTYSNSNEKIAIAEVSAFQCALINLGKVSKTKTSELETILYGEYNQVRVEDAKLLLQSGIAGVWIVESNSKLTFHHATQWYISNLRMAKISL